MSSEGAGASWFVRNRIVCSIVESAAAMTPYGAAAEGNALSNFNIDWQDKQLMRQIAGLGSAASTYGGLIGAGSTAAQPAEAALQGYTSGFDTASRAQTEQSRLEERAREFNIGEQDKQNQALSDLGSSGGDLFGSILTKGGGGGL
jgi:hypothetical protein